MSVKLKLSDVYSTHTQLCSERESNLKKHISGINCVENWYKAACIFLHTSLVRYMSANDRWTEEAHESCCFSIAAVAATETIDDAAAVAIALQL